MPTQPWISRENALGHLWVRDLIRAVDDGFISREDVENHVRQEFVRPSLVYQLDHRVEQAGRLPADARKLDSDFVPPYLRMSPQQGAARKGPLQAARALLRRVSGRGAPGGSAEADRHAAHSHVPEE
jgi:hypothetical protein